MEVKAPRHATLWHHTLTRLSSSHNYLLKKTEKKGNYCLFNNLWKTNQQYIMIQYFYYWTTCVVFFFNTSTFDEHSAMYKVSYNYFSTKRVVDLVHRALFLISVTVSPIITAQSITQICKVHILRFSVCNVAWRKVSLSIIYDIVLLLNILISNKAISKLFLS